MPNVSTLTLNNDVEMPALGLGVFQTPAEETSRGRSSDFFRLPAHRHGSCLRQRRQVGEAVRSSGLDRSEVFLETKIWISDYGYDKTLHGFDKRRKLGVDQIDLLILHQALPPSRRPWRLTGARRRCRRRKVRAIGVSNFMVEYLTTLLERAAWSRQSIRSRSPLLRAEDVQTFNAEHGIVTQAWSPIGGITFYRDGRHSSTLQDPIIGDIQARRQDSRSGHAALAPTAAPLGDPEVDQPAADRREHRRVRLRTLH